MQEEERESAPQEAAALFGVLVGSAPMLRGVLLLLASVGAAGITSCGWAD